tara:strand:+ start:55 stop:870 length:816 start_codon:yes stop_codon:yes gene_type:complete
MNEFKNQILSFRYFFLLIIFFALFLIFEGVIHNHYQIFSYYFYSELRIDRGGYNSLFWEENGIVEFAQVIILLLSIIILFRYIKVNFKNLSSFFRIITIIYFIGLFYYFFEEISYGQHLFLWITPDFFSKLNSQNETNFHNMSNLLNELPRTLLLLFCTISFLIEKLINHRSKYFALFILPNPKLKYISYLILFFVLPDLIVDFFNIKPIIYSWKVHEPLIQWGWTFYIDLIQLITFNFIRLSELQELLFNFYIIGHAYYLKNFFYLRDIK